MRFKVNINGIIEADNIDDAMMRLGKYFIDITKKIDIDGDFVGLVSIKPKKVI